MRCFARLAAAAPGARAFALLAALTLAVACGTPKPAEEAAPVDPAAGPRTENAALSIALASVPAAFRVEVNEVSELRLVRSDGTPGTLHFEVTPVLGGVNLIEALKGHQQAIEAQPGGEYKGQIELRSPLGTTFASRGRYGVVRPDAVESEGGVTEEFRVFGIHPDGSQLLTIVYSYPAGTDTAARRDELLALLGEIEPVGVSP